MTANRRRRRWGAFLAVAGLVLVVGAYATADAADLVPGVLTTRPEPRPDPPFPTIVMPDAAPAAAVAGPDAQAPEPGAAPLADATDELLDAPGWARRACW